MANSNFGFPIFILAALLLASSTIATSQAPFIVAHKKASLTSLKPGSERVSVSIDIYNQGSATAYDVTLHDDNWSSDVFGIVAGNTSVSWERLDAGVVLSHSFELEAKTKTVFYSPPAVVTYRVPTKSTLQEAFSTPILPLEILADRPPVKKLDWAKKLLAKYGSLVSVVIIVVLFVYLVASPSSGAKGSKKKR
ncbi:translocon-associated protein subunit beta-like [Salvia splendens]|uniref:translocon-associated protein subunit beta-like n=1 Tax=Salvia splendens TaxID=180675 RepID=UPI001C2737BC|nr:translocon-associated protein subunit beta-like [Salvia splendens]XP_042019949.1 translocon-associated protein subunit beta-like [Salvia splendens]